ncbi:MAG: putative rane-associated acetyltransferase [Gemmataceae bacterium]|nr:putative rane-associated acetyltransferase [Gemmataceae bacterium]
MRSYLHNLQALRGVACLLVVAYHAATWEGRFGVSPSLLKPTLWFGYAGVDLFFVLSGFVIAATNRDDLGRPTLLPTYLFRRAWRIYPTYWAALAVAIGVFAALASDPVVTPDWAEELQDCVLLLPTPNLSRFLAVAWTLSFELMFYAAFAILFLLPRRAAAPALFGWAVAVLVCSAVGHRPQNRFAALPVSPFVLEFLAGVLVAWCPVHLGRRAAAATVVVGAGWCGVFSALLFDPDPTKLPTAGAVRVFVFGLPAALLVGAAAGAERAGWRFRARWLGAVGNGSYSVYLLHVPLLFVTTHLTIAAGWSHTRLPHIGWVVVVLAGGVLPGLLFFQVVERPLLGLAKRWKPKRPPVPTPAPAPGSPPIRRAA